MAPTSPANITTGVMRVSSTSPPEMVLATSTERNAPTRFSTPATATAVRGPSAPVEIDMAIAFAVSWNPLVKSKTSAVATTTRTISHVLMDLLSGRGRCPAASRQQRRCASPRAGDPAVSTPRGVRPTDRLTRSG
jgi:hypothetical protein